MSSRENILSRIRTALEDDPPLDRPPVPEVWPRTNPTTGKKVERFSQELEAVAGDVYRCASEREARKKLAELVGQIEEGTIGAIDAPLVREVTSGLPPDRVHWGASDAEV